MELGVKHRLVLLGTLAGAQGNLSELRILRELREALSFSEKEHKDFSIRIEDGMFHWDNEAKGQIKDIEIGKVARGIIVDRLCEMDKQKALADDHVDVIDLFPEVESG